MCELTPIIGRDKTVTPIRIQKFLSQAGHCSRRAGEQLIRAGRVRVNGQVVCELGTKIDPSADHVEVDGHRVVIQEEKHYIALYKPVGYVTSCSHPGQKIVLDLVAVSQRVYPVGRLDKQSEGLILLTNDGRLHHRMTHPSFDHEKEYQVTVKQDISDPALGKLARGVDILGKRTRPAKISRISPNCFRIVLQEGRNRQIRRMVEQAGNKVIRLKRTRMASIQLGALLPGQWRPLTEAEKDVLLKIL